MSEKQKSLDLSYKRALKNLKSRIRYAEKRGFETPYDIIPKRPKKITEASIERLNKIRAPQIHKKSVIKPPDYKPKKAKVTSSKKGKKPKKTTKKQGKQKRDKYYQDKHKQKGKGTPPKQAEEFIINVAESFGYQAPEEQLVDTLSQERNFYDEIISKLTSYSPPSGFSKNLQVVKANEVADAVKIIAEAVQNYGISNVAYNLYEHIGEVNQIIEEIMYRGYGRDYTTGRTAVKGDVARLKEILTGQSLTQEENKQYSQALEDEEYEDVLE